MVRFDSWRAVRLGNWLGWNLVTKSTEGGRATWQAVTRVKLEQASKGPMWCRPGTEAGKAESIRKNPARERVKAITIGTDRTTGVVSTACQEGNHASVGEALGGGGVATCQRSRKGQRTSRASERARGTGSRVARPDGSSQKGIWRNRQCVRGRRGRARQVAALTLASSSAQRAYNSATRASAACTFW